MPRIVYHGTTADLADEIEARGLRPRNGTGPFVTSYPARARAHGVRACCRALAAKDPACRPEDLPPALLVTVSVPATALLADPSHTTDYLLTDPSAVVKLSLETFDPREWSATARPTDRSPLITTAMHVRKLANLVMVARTLEDKYFAMRLGLDVEDRVRKGSAKLDTGTSPFDIGTRLNPGKLPGARTRIKISRPDYPKPPSTGKRLDQSGSA